MVLIVSQLDLQALSKFNYCHICFDSPRYCIRSCKLNSNLPVVNRFHVTPKRGKMFLIAYGLDMCA